MKFHLIHMSGPQEGRSVMFENPTVIIGRDPGCDFRFPADLYPTMPPQFAQIVTDGRGSCAIQYIVPSDAPSFGTILLNGVPMERPSEVLPTDTAIQFGVHGPSLFFRIGIPTIGTNSYMPAKPKVLAKLEMLSGADKGRVFELTSAGPLRIGRNINMELPLSPMGDMFVSGRHAIIDLPPDGQWQITDTSRYGTLVNGRVIGTAALHNNDVIGFGKKGPQARFITGPGLIEAAAMPQEMKAAPVAEAHCVPREAIAPMPSGPVPTAVTEPERTQPKPVADMDAPIPIPVMTQEPTASQEKPVVATSPFARNGAPGVPPARDERTVPGLRRKRIRRIKPTQTIAISLTICFVLICLGYWAISMFFGTNDKTTTTTVEPQKSEKVLPKAQPTKVPTITPAVVASTPIPQPSPAPVTVIEDPLSTQPAATSGHRFATADGIVLDLPSTEWEILPRDGEDYVIKTPSGVTLRLRTTPNATAETVMAALEKFCKENGLNCSRSKNGTSILFKAKDYNYVIPIERSDKKVVSIVVVVKERLKKAAMAEIVKFADLLANSQGQ